MCPYPRFLLPGLAMVALGGCVQPTPPEPPEGVTRAMADALIDTGFYGEVAITRTIGRHYNPAEDAWTIVACYRFTVPDGRQGTSCLDSFSAVQLENGTWLVAATVNGVYRWRAIGLSQDAVQPSLAPGQPAGAPGTQPPAQQPEPQPEQPTEQPEQPPGEEQESGQSADPDSEPA